MPAALPDMNVDASIVAPSPLPLYERAARQGATVKLALLNKTIADDYDYPAVPAPPRSERHRNLFSRFFRGVFRGTPPVAPGTEIP